MGDVTRRKRARAATMIDVCVYVAMNGRAGERLGGRAGVESLVCVVVGVW